MSSVVNVDVSDEIVALPVDKKKLGDFISGLLGQPQTIEKKYLQPFSVDHQWFIHFFTTLMQRVHQQNSPEPLAFEVEIEYRDKLIRKISSWSAFQHFSETQNIVSVAAKFHFAILIQFPNKKIPERQEIIIDFDAAEKKHHFLERVLESSSEGASIEVEIRHTERTWADDIFRLIENEFQAIQTPEGALRKILRKYIYPFFFLGFPLAAVLSLLYSGWVKRGYMDELIKTTESFGENTKHDLATLHAKVDALLNSSINNSSVKNGEELLIVYFIGVFVVMLIAGVILSNPSPSFVVLSNAAKINMEKVLERQKRTNFWVLVSLVLSVVLSVVANFIYDFIK